MIKTTLPLALLALTPALYAQDYPQRPVTLVVPFAAGASLGSVAHIVAERLSARMKQPFLVEYKAGASGTIGTGFVAKAKPDGYTLLVSATGPMSIVPTVYRNLSYTINDFAPVAQFMRVPFVVATSPAFKGSNVKDLIEQLRREPDRHSFASTGNGTLVHLAGQLLIDQANSSATHIPYSAGSQVATALIRGDVLFSVANISTVSAHFAEGKIKPLATTGLKRFALLPDLPTVAESGYPTFEVGHYVGVFAPRGVPDEVLRKLNANINEVLADPAVIQAFRTQGDLPQAATTEEFAATVKSDAQKWGDMGRKMGLKNE